MHIRISKNFGYNCVTLKLQAKKHNFNLLKQAMRSLKTAVAKTKAQKYAERKGEKNGGEGARVCHGILSLILHCF